MNDDFFISLSLINSYLEMENTMKDQQGQKSVTTIQEGSPHQHRQLATQG